MEQENSQVAVDTQQDSDKSAVDQYVTTNPLNGELNSNSELNNAESVSRTFNYSQSQLQWMNRQVCNLERELLLNNNRYAMPKLMNNWTKVILTAIACLIPGIGQIIGIIVGLVLVSNDTDSDKRSFGAALLTVTIIAFIILSVFWFVIFMSLGPALY